MSFRLKRDASIASEIRRLVSSQLEVAISELRTVGDPESDEAVHDARRRVKKIRAVIRLVRPALDKRYRAVDRELKDVSKLLAPVADGQGIIETLDQLAHRYRKLLPQRAVRSIRAGLRARSARIDHDANNRGLIQIAAETLRGERKQVKYWAIHGDGFNAIASGLEESYRRARDGMILAWSKPKASHYHSWRRYVKDHWFHVRLLEDNCGNHLLAYQRRIEALDGVLGEYHNLVILREVLASDGYTSRKETARCLGVVTRYQRLLRRHAESLGIRIYGEKPHRYVRRVERLWTGGRTAADARPARSEA
jgi:CHAD domain-containing protein